MFQQFKSSETSRMQTASTHSCCFSSCAASSRICSNGQPRSSPLLEARPRRERGISSLPCTAARPKSADSRNKRKYRQTNSRCRRRRGRPRPPQPPPPLRLRGQHVTKVGPSDGRWVPMTAYLPHPARRPPEARRKGMLTPWARGMRAAQGGQRPSTRWAPSPDCQLPPQQDLERERHHPIPVLSQRICAWKHVDYFPHRRKKN